MADGVTRCRVVGKQKLSSRSLDSIEPVELGGLRQWIALRSQDTTKPILLFLHGGPGGARIASSRKPQQELEKDFIVVDWDQRGAGRSYSSALNSDEMRIELFVSDAEELAQILLRRFGQQKLFLVGHSWGSVIGIQLAARRPDLIAAYVGIGQVVDMMRGEEISYRFTLNEAKRRGVTKAVAQLTKIGAPPYTDHRAVVVQRKWLGRFGGQTHGGSTLGLMLKNLSWRDLSLFGVYGLIRGTVFSLKNLQEQLNAVDILQAAPELDMPVFFCCGRYDYTVPFELVTHYAATLRAPKKTLVWFDRSAHSPNLEETLAFQRFCATYLTADILAPAKSHSNIDDALVEITA